MRRLRDLLPSQHSDPQRVDAQPIPVHNTLENQLFIVAASQKLGVWWSKHAKSGLETVSCTFWGLGITPHRSPLLLAHAHSWDYMLGQVGQSLSVRRSHQLGVLGSNQPLKMRGIEIVMRF